MKKLMAIAIAVLMLCSFSIVTAGDMWFDMENCEMCKPMASVKGLMEHMTCGQYKISNGVLMSTTVPSDLMEAYEKADAEMMATGERLMKGETMPLCGSCQALSAVFAKGLKEETVKTETGSIMLFTSDNPEVVKEVHAWADRNAEEMAKFMESMESDDMSHEGHDH